MNQSSLVWAGFRFKLFLICDETKFFQQFVEYDIFDGGLKGSVNIKTLQSKKILLDKFLSGVPFVCVVHSFFIFFDRRMCI